jgi:hypothetical protein
VAGMPFLGCVFGLSMCARAGPVPAALSRQWMAGECKTWVAGECKHVRAS